MLGQFMSGLVSDEDKANASSDMMSLAMAKIAGEFGLTKEEISFFIRPHGDDWTPVIDAVQLKNGAPVKMLRIVSLLEVVQAGKEG